MQRTGQILFSEWLDRKEVQKKLKGQGGLIAYLGVNDLREAEKLAGIGSAGKNYHRRHDHAALDGYRFACPDRLWQGGQNHPDRRHGAL